jgi:hypothetical protein
MTDFDQFERRLAAAIRSDADMSVGPFDAASIAREAIDGTRAGAPHLPRATSRPGGRLGRGRGVTLLAAAALLLVGGALAVGSGLVRLPSIVPPVPVPSVALDATPSPGETTTPTPSAATSPSPTPGLDLTWTQVPLTEQEPHLAWLGDRFALADAKSGSVRTSTDGETWQPVQPGDAAAAYVDLATGRSASWQHDVVGWLNPEDGPDTTAPLPSNAQHIVTVVRPPAAPISTVPFKGQIESMGIGPKGIFAEVHSSLDFDHWVTRKLGLRTNNDWTMHVKSVTFENGVLQIKLTNRPGLKVVWADQGFEPGDFGDSGFAWYSADGEHWTELPPRGTSQFGTGSALPTGAFGQVVGVSDGFIASGTCANFDLSCSGMWHSADGLSWQLLENAPGGGDLRPWMGGALVTDGNGGFEVWTSGGSSKLPIAADLPNTQLPVAVGPLGLVSVSMEDRETFVSRDGINFALSPIPAQMSDAFKGRLWGPHAPTVAVGDRTVLDLEWSDDGNNPAIPSLWLGTFGP